MSASRRSLPRAPDWILRVLAIAPARVAPAASAEVAERAERAALRAGLDPDRPLLEVPEPAEGMEIVDVRPLADGAAAVRILLDPRTLTHEYEILEPRLQPAEAAIRDFLHQTLLQTLPPRPGTRAEQAAYLAERVEAVVRQHSVALDEVGRRRVAYHLERDLLGHGPIDALLRDPEIEDVSCDGPGIPLYVFHRAHESIRTNVVFPDERELDRFVIKLAQRSGKQITVADPLLDATLPDMSRLQATLAREVTTRGSSFTIRKFREDPFTPADLIRFGSLDANVAAWLWLALEAGQNIIFAGATASGKTTLLNAACLFIPPQKKIVSIEETREINLVHENWIAAATRTAFTGETGDGRGSAGIGMYRLLEAALRQRPEYILVGEVRGAETFTLFQAMSTGHAVYSTMHADSARAAVHRLENAPIDIPRLMVQEVNAFVVQGVVRVGSRLVRRVLQVVEVTGIDPESGDLLTNDAFSWDSERDAYRWLGKSHTLDRIAQRRNEPVEATIEDWAARAAFLRRLAQLPRQPLATVTGAFRAYRQDPALGHEILAALESPPAPPEIAAESADTEIEGWGPR